jgi:hypothetical protein
MARNSSPVDAENFRRAALANEPAVKSLAAGNVDDGLSRRIADQFHQGEGFDTASPGLQFGSLILLGDGVIIGCHGPACIARWN